MEVQLANLGLSDQKIQETIKNSSLTQILVFILEEAQKYGAFDKNIGTLLYSLGTKLGKQYHEHLPLLVKYVASGKLNQDAKLNAAIKYVQDNVAKGIHIEEFENYCGVGVEVSDNEIINELKKIISQNEACILKERYHFNFGMLMGQLRQSLKWADTKKVKDELDAQILSLLGPKTEQDLIKPSKKKGKVEKRNEPSLPLANGDALPSDNANTNADKAPVITMADFLKTVRFHEPGENYKTDGYIIHDKTHELLKEHMRITGGKVRTRFPPEPNGILHIGHAKAININFGYAKAKNGVCYLRYDDTNPEKEEEKFFLEIENMVEWLGYTPAKITYSSDYFDQLFEWAVELVKKNLAYVCHQKPEEVRGRDSTLSPWRDRPANESLRLFYLMKKGYFDEGEATLRLKVTLEEGKVDPVAYRVKYVAHHRTEDRWCIYPTYDYTHCLCDSIEHITHSLCTKEFQNRRSSYYWLCNSIGVYCPVQWEYGRLNMLYTVLSKRKIARLIESGIVKDWDDPRLFTLTALRRRGVPALAINNFCASLGLTGAQTALHPDALDAAVRDLLNGTATRAMVVLDPLRVEISNFPFAEPCDVRVPNVPGDDQAGHHVVPFDATFWIERTDFRESDEKGFRRLTPTQSVGLRHAGYVISLQEAVRDSRGVVQLLRATCEPATAKNKPKAFVHWVACPISCRVRLYERLFLHENPEDSGLVPGGFLSDVNPSSMTELTQCLADRSVVEASRDARFQFERVGFFCFDPDSNGSDLVFNRIVSLKEDKGKL